MPFQSEKQRRYLHANHPEIAKRWEKEYSNGGILDIDGSEEITTEEGNDISLVDESEIGVSTLFRAKNGGNATKNIKGQPHMLAYITPGEAKTLENLGGQKTMTKEGIPAYPPSDNYGGTHGSSNDFSGMDSGGWDPGVSSPGTTSSGGNVNTGGGDQEDDVAQMMSDMNITPDHSPNYTGSDAGWVVSEDEETERRQEEFKVKTAMLVEALDVEDVIAQLLVNKMKRKKKELLKLMQI